MPVLAQDDFSAALSDIWVTVIDTTTVAGNARMVCRAAEDEFSELATERLYPLRDSTYTTELVTRPDIGIGTTLAILDARIDRDNLFSIYLNNDVVNFQEVIAGVSVETTVLYDAEVHRWWRIRIEGHTVFWETSPDGATWTTRRTKEAGIDVDEPAEGRLVCGYYGPEGALSPDYAEFGIFTIEGPLFKPLAVTGVLAGLPLCRSAKLTGSVDPNLSETTYHFEIGESTEYGRSAPVAGGEIAAGKDPVPVSAHVGGLKPNTVYHYRLVAVSEGGTSEGEDKTFTTSPGVRVGGLIVDPIIRRRVFNGLTLADYAELQERTEREGEPELAITEVPDPDGSDRTVFKLTVADDDVFPVTPTENPRAQALGPDVIRPGDIIETRFEFWLPADFPDNTPGVGEENGFLALFSHCYGPPFEGSSPFGIAVEGFPLSTLHWQRNSVYNYDIPWQVPMVKEQWIRIRSRFRFAVKGWVEMWVDGDPITFFTPGSSYNPNGEELTRKLRMQTRDASNNAADNHSTISNYRRAGMYEYVTLYHGPLLVDRITPVAVRL